MRKLFALAVILTMSSTLYGLQVGFGGAYQNIAGPEGTDPYLGIKADVRVPLFSMIDVRANILDVSMQTDAKSLLLGTFTDSDLMIKFPMEGTFKPYVAAGLWFGKGLETGAGMSLHLKAALGANLALGGLTAFLEGGLGKFSMVKLTSDADAVTENPIYVQLGLIFNVGK